MGLGYVLSPTGADHMHNMHDSFFTNEESPAFNAVRNMGILDAVDTFELSPAKARLFVYMMLNKSINNNLALCSFMPYTLDMMVNQVKAATGWNVSNWELLKATERTFNMARAFNAREGFTAADDILPDRFFEPLEGGPLQGKKLDRDQFFETRAITYDMLGWDRQAGTPKRWKLFELGLGWVAEDLEKRGVLKRDA
jgi:aldehyde:ferredoxin oxidoreductase